MARIFSPRRSPAPRKARPLSQAGVGDAAHQARADAECAAAVAAVDRAYESDKVSAEIDLTDSCMAAVEAAEARASELGATSTRSTHGGRVVVKLALGSGG